MIGTDSISSWCARGMLGAFLGVIFCAGSAHAEQLDFVLDSSLSYLTLAIPNFSISSTPFSITGQNRTNGSSLVTAWSTTTGSTAFLSGSFSTTIGGNFSGGTISSVQFIAGSSTLTAIASGNYRPNPAAYNASGPTPVYNNNSPHAANYGGTIHSATLGNAGYFSLSNSTYDLHTTSPLAVTSNQFPVNLAGNALITGLTATTFALQGGNTILGPIIADQLTSPSGLANADTSTSLASFVFDANHISAKLTIPVSVPFSIPVGGGIFLNGTATGRLVALSPVPEPSTLGLASLAGAFLTVWIRRRKRAGVCRE